MAFRLCQLAGGSPRARMGNQRCQRDEPECNPAPLALAKSLRSSNLPGLRPDHGRTGPIPLPRTLFGSNRMPCLIPVLSQAMLIDHGPEPFPADTGLLGTQNASQHTLGQRLVRDYGMTVALGISLAHEEAMLTRAAIFSHPSFSSRRQSCWPVRAGKGDWGILSGHGGLQMHFQQVVGDQNRVFDLLLFQGT